jgi:hypothetical protein
MSEIKEKTLKEQLTKSLSDFDELPPMIKNGYKFGSPVSNVSPSKNDGTKQSAVLTTIGPKQDI